MATRKVGFILLAIALALLTRVGAITAYELTDDNFEHDTQATTGSTTGEWLILFCDFTKFKRCKDLVPVWDELAGVLYGRITVASIDV